MGEKKNKVIGTPYDDVFRTLLNDCSALMIPVINEMFGEHYTGEEEIIFSPNEHFLNQQDGVEEKRITDSSFTIAGKEEKRFLCECQSIADNSMLVRIFEYAALSRIRDNVSYAEKRVIPKNFNSKQSILYFQMNYKEISA